MISLFEKMFGDGFWDNAILEVKLYLSSREKAKIVSTLFSNFRQRFGPTATTQQSEETSRSQWSRRPGGLRSSTRSWGRSSVSRRTCRLSSSTPTTRRRTPRSWGPSIEIPMSSSGRRNYQISTNHMPLFQVRQYKQAVRLQGHQDRLDWDHGADQLTGPGQREGWQVPCVHQCEQRVQVALTMTFTSRCARRKRTSARL